MTTMQKPLQPIEECANLFSLIFERGDRVEFRCHRVEGEVIQTTWVDIGEDEKGFYLKQNRSGGLAAKLDQWNAEGYSIYFGANPQTGNTHYARCHFVDIENIKWDEIRSDITDVLPMPTAVVESGAGVHLWWRLPQIVYDMKDWKYQQKALIAKVHLVLNTKIRPEGCKVDGGLHNPQRVMRAPGWINCKRGRGQKASLVFHSTRVDVWPRLQLVNGNEPPATSPTYLFDPKQPAAINLTATQYIIKVGAGWWDVTIGRHATIYKAAEFHAMQGLPLFDAKNKLVEAARQMHNYVTKEFTQDELNDLAEQIATAYKGIEEKHPISPLEAVATLAHRIQRAGMTKAVSTTLAGLGAFKGHERIGLNVPSMPALTSRLFGLRGLIMCGGMPGCGKTVLVMQAALDAVRADNDVCAVLVSFEMSRAEIITRWMSTVAESSDRQVITSQDPGRRKKIVAASNELQRLSVTPDGRQRIYIFEPADIGRMDGSNGAALIELINEVKIESGCSRCITVCDPFQGMPYHCTGKGELDRDRELMAYLLAANRATGEHDPLIVVTETVNSSWHDEPEITNILNSERLGYSSDVVIAMRPVALREGTELHRAVMDEIGGDPVDHRLVQVCIVKGRRCTKRGNVWFIMDTLSSSFQEVTAQTYMNQAHHALDEENKNTEGHTRNKRQ